jgi:hypothetical protein
MNCLEKPTFVKKRQAIKTPRFYWVFNWTRMSGARHRFQAEAPENQQARTSQSHTDI